MEDFPLKRQGVTMRLHHGILRVSSLGKKGQLRLFSGELFGVLPLVQKFSPKIFVENVSYKGLLELRQDPRPFRISGVMKSCPCKPLGLPMLLTPHTNLLLRSNSPPKRSLKPQGLRGNCEDFGEKWSRFGMVQSF